MNLAKVLAALITLSLPVTAIAQQVGQPQLKIDSANRTLTVTAEESVTAEPDVAILHIGFDTQPGDAKAVYAEGAQTSNAIIGAIKQAGVSADAFAANRNSSTATTQSPRPTNSSSRRDGPSNPRRNAPLRFSISPLPQAPTPVAQSTGPSRTSMPCSSRRWTTPPHAPEKMQQSLPREWACASVR